MSLSISSLYPHLLLFLFIFHNALTCSAAGGSWSLVLENAGISAMHMQLLPTDRVVMFDRADFGTSKIALPPGKCQGPKDCSAHSVEYDVATKTVRPLLLQTDTWCSSGTLMPDGNLVQTGGWGKGDKVVRLYKSCDECDWKEIPNGLAEGRWYATNHMLPDHRQIVIGGRAQFNFEFIPKAPGEKTFDFPFLAQTSDPNENNLYPFVAHYLGPVLFVFANNRAILFDYSKNQVVKVYPTIPGGQPRNYPSTGSGVLLPLRIKNGAVQAYEVVVCGGAYKTAFANALNGKFEVALDTCARIGLSDPKPEWVMETMPIPRLMGDMVMLPNSEVLIINGANKGVAGWELGRDPVLHPVIYKPDNKIGERFEVQNPTTIPRMYHSTAVLLRQGDVLVAGSNPHENYEFAGALFPTELRVESFKPSYLDPINALLRPEITMNNLIEMQYEKPFVIPFILADIMDPKTISVNMVSLPFNTHSYSMNQRLLVLDSAVPVKQGVEKNSYIVGAAAPPSADIAPPGYYMVFVVNKGIPSAGIWAKIG